MDTEKKEPTEEELLRETARMILVGASKVELSQLTTKEVIRAYTEASYHRESTELPRFARELMGRTDCSPKQFFSTFSFDPYRTSNTDHWMLEVEAFSLRPDFPAALLLEKISKKALLSNWPDDDKEKKTHEKAVTSYVVKGFKVLDERADCTIDLLATFEQELFKQDHRPYNRHNATESHFSLKFLGLLDEIAAKRLKKHYFDDLLAIVTKERKDNSPWIPNLAWGEIVSRFGRLTPFELLQLIEPSGRFHLGKETLLSELGKEERLRELSTGKLVELRRMFQHSSRTTEFRCQVEVELLSPKRIAELREIAGI